MFLAGDTRNVLAPAKVNLFLEVLGKRPDGYHDIRSVVAPVSLFDEVGLTATGGAIETTTILSDDLPTEMAAGLDSEHNLATRAARLLRDETGHAGGARIELTKRIPVGGGMGGGSSDAAAVLVGLNELWGTRVPRQRLIEIGARLGSDVPALVHGGLVLAEGVGERVRPVLEGRKRFGSENHPPMRVWWLVLANPLFAVSTRDMYARWKPSLTGKAHDINNTLLALGTGDTRQARSMLFNGLEETVCRKYPAIEMLIEAVRRSGALSAIMSGSGASVFGVAEDEASARRVEMGLRDHVGFPIWSTVVRLLPDGVMAAHGPLEARV
jgi:4-diphosphocytidyl-2-C-methyl-D-erythritol kinase